MTVIHGKRALMRLLKSASPPPTEAGWRDLVEVYNGKNKPFGVFHDMQYTPSRNAGNLSIMNWLFSTTELGWYTADGQHDVFKITPDNRNFAQKFVRSFAGTFEAKSCGHFNFPRSSTRFQRTSDTADGT